MTDDSQERATQIAELVKRIAEQKRREAAASQALERARKSIERRERFVPKQIVPNKPIELSF
jgi:hypothetical protein